MHYNFLFISKDMEVQKSLMECLTSHSEAVRLFMNQAMSALAIS